MNRIEQTIEVPTGHILTRKGNTGRFVECVSLGDYGKSQNIKADFLGFSDKINGVEHGSLLPLEEKWVATLSTQYGCSMGCRFCDVPKVGPGINCTIEDLRMQMRVIRDLHPEVRRTKRLNVHYARMGEPTFNSNVMRHALELHADRNGSHIHPVISTMMPKVNKNLLNYLQQWMAIKNEVYCGEAGLQFSINSTDDEQRTYLFNGASRNLTNISYMGKQLANPLGRKIALNFAITKDTIFNGSKLAKLFNPEHFMVKITPIHETSSSIGNSLETKEGYSKYAPYEAVEASSLSAGFDTLVFIPSKEEDSSRITCGNAVLSDEVVWQP